MALLMGRRLRIDEMMDAYTLRLSVKLRTRFSSPSVAYLCDILPICRAKMMICVLDARKAYGFRARRHIVRR